MRWDWTTGITSLSARATLDPTDPKPTPMSLLIPRVPEILVLSDKIRKNVPVAAKKHCSFEMGRMKPDVLSKHDCILIGIECDMRVLASVRHWDASKHGVDALSQSLESLPLRFDPGENRNLTKIRHLTTWSSCRI